MGQLCKQLLVGTRFLRHRSNKYFELPNYILLENGLIKKWASLSELPGSAATLCWDDSMDTRVCLQQTMRGWLSPT